ncbi:MAG TPA: hypothetical protein VLM37_05415 [Fibrobacteraceae bacterium]|nr:hypothetical protein [Fibrobacteraceae bacterium]
MRKNKVYVLVSMLFFAHNCISGTWTAYLSTALDGVYLKIADSTIAESGFSDSADLYCYGPDLELSCSTPNFDNIWAILDTSSLNFDNTLSLKDTAIFEDSTNHIVLDEGSSSYFVLKLLSGNFALCQDSISVVGTCYTGSLTCSIQSVTLYLACQVQDDGTTKFDSIPQYPYDTTTATVPRSMHTSSLNIQGPPYRVNGARATGNGAVGVRVRAMGKE